MESAQTQSSGKEKKGLRRIWRRIRDIIRQKPITTTPQTTVQSTTTPAITTKPAPAPEPSETPQPAPVKTQDPPNKQDIKIEVDDTADEPLKPTELTPLPQETSTTTSGGPSNEADMRFQKAQAIFARYNIQLNETDWDMRPRVPYERVSKNIRMRAKGLRMSRHHVMNARQVLKLEQQSVPIVNTKYVNAVFEKPQLLSIARLT
ncbi:hypothetical protein LTR10_014267 [Elasticomyces elasticus]|uniref:Uncharacterized protein n=1 Tax=Exophiala sideris TaxID=1016849 RepID=A0ABR0JJ53_9EURO|nr:hypothetical protein LTR10_014267 [Elasticomyces elasticus]KAK5034308.1 hypothetical protein LTS07_003228 [Exophiala sideris]KAK5042605.1 hypothetical protein LTR13_001452 [Exophiala sideris]KAK5065687.1 hypothetical protein LTR69_003236 [Exophiala sideris]KAK5185855.1 hypothetical protein LTR44_001904 [Eurotiomycetes sp. CCFEE 6388]